jgi:hypothetical protein
MDGVIWNTLSLMVYMDCSGEIVLQEKPGVRNGELTSPFIFVSPEELKNFCKHYLSLLESEE